jgi:hypothetical protein
LLFQESDMPLSGDYGGVPIAPWQQVDRGLSIAYEKAQTAFNLATQYIDSLSTFEIDPISTSVTITPPNFSTSFQTPAQPTQPSLAFDSTVANIPAPPAITPSTLLSPTAPPTFDGVRPSVDFSGQPSPLAEAAHNHRRDWGDSSYPALTRARRRDSCALRHRGHKVQPSIERTSMGQEVTPGVGCPQRHAKVGTFGILVRPVVGGVIGGGLGLDILLCRRCAQVVI